MAGQLCLLQCARLSRGRGAAQSGPEYENAVHEAQAGDYPEGRYESALQTAAECGDQHELDRLFARRSRSQTLRLAIIMFLAAPIIAILLSGCVSTPQAGSRSQLELAPVQRLAGPGRGASAKTGRRVSRDRRQTETFACRVEPLPPR